MQQSVKQHQAKQKTTPLGEKYIGLFLCSRIQHVFDEDAIFRCGVVDQNMGDGADEFVILDDGAAGHFCVK